MPGSADETAAYRPLLFSIAYGMTGSVGDAEDGGGKTQAIGTVVVQTMHAVVNPDKLAHLGPVSDVARLAESRPSPGGRGADGGA